MPVENPKILLTGMPGCGKTTTVMKITAALPLENRAGFYTQEIRENNARKGFKWVSLDGTSGILAHVDIRGAFRVGKYGVDVASFEKSVVPIMDNNLRPGANYKSGAGSNAQLIIIDEIGKMECMSERFINAVRTLFASDKCVLATVAQKGSGLISEVKDYPQTRLFNLTRTNQEKIVAEILQILSFLKKSL